MIGQYARSIAGHDNGQLYVILSIEGKKVTVADGRLRRVESPKIKNMRHIQIIESHVNDDVLDAIVANKANVNDLIRIAIKQEEKNV